VRLVAAWATSHEAVRLTPVLELVVVLEDEGAVVTNNSEKEGNPETGPEGGVVGDGRMAKEKQAETEGNPETGPEAGLVQQLKEELKEFVQEQELEKRQQQRPNDNNNDDPQARHDAARRDPIQGIQAQIERAQKEKKRQAVDSAQERLAALDARHAEQAQDRRQKLTDTGSRVQDRVMRDRHAESVYQRHNKNKISEDRSPKTTKKHHPLLRYEIGFDVVHERLSVGSYFQGALWMIGGSVALTYACLWASRRGGGKGRRDL